MAPRTIVFVTGNPLKLKEVRAFLGEETDPKFVLVNQELDLPEVQGTIEEVATEKVRRAAELVKGPVLVEDTALCFKALGGLPGPYIKWFLKELGCDGLNTLLDGFPTRAATAVCTFAYSPGPSPSNPTAPPEILLFQGRTEGTIVPARGPAYFGWNPVFEVEGTEFTYAEMDTEAKNKISHRSRALEKLKAYLDALPAEELAPA